MNRQPMAIQRLVFTSLAGLLLATPFADAQDGDAQFAAGQFVKVGGTIDDTIASRVTNLALKLQNQAIQEDREVILILEITGGGSKFGQVRDLAKFLTSSRVNRLRTVAWIDSNVTGKNVILALACNEIVMHPDAELGDIGRGESVDADEQEFVMSLVRDRHNRMVSQALAQAMMDRNFALSLVTKEAEGGGVETQVLSKKELQVLLDGNVALTEVITIKEAKDRNVFTGREASKNGFLVVQARETRRDVADLYRLPLEAMREAAAPEEVRNVKLIKIDEMIEPVIDGFVRRQIDRAVAGGANTIIFQIDSPGGFVDSGRNIGNAIANLADDDVRTIAYIPSEAISMAAVIALCCDEIYMHRGASIGDAEIIELRDGAFQAVPEKIYSEFRTFLRSIAKRKGRPEALYVAMNDPDLEVFRATHAETGRLTFMSADEIDESNGKWIKGAKLKETGNKQLLTVDGERAHELGLAMAPVLDLEELQVRVGLPPGTKLKPIGRTWVDTLVFVLNTDLAMFLLVVFGIAFIYMEAHFMTGLLGILSAVCFGVFFWSRFLGGTAGYLEIILFVIGIACIVMEIFVMPGFGVFGLSGGLLIIASLILAANTYSFSDSGDDLSKLTPAVGTLAAAVCCFVVGAVAMNRYLPKLPLFNKMILTPPGADEDGPMLRPEFTLAGGSAPGTDNLLVGERGKAASKLRPAGKAQVGDHFVDVVSDGPFINAGTPIEVVSIQGNKITVRAIGPEETDGIS